MTDFVVSSGYASSGVTVNSGDTLTVLSGGSATSTTVSNGGYEYVSSGGSVSGTTVGSGGYEYISAGGAATGTTVDSGGDEIISSGGVASGTTLSSGGFATVGAGGTAVGMTVDHFGALFVYGTASGTHIYGAPAADAGIAYVYSGGSLVDTTVLGGSQVIVFAGGGATGTVVSSAFIQLEGGTASGTILVAGGEQDVGGLGSAVDTTVGSGSYEYVSSGTTIGTTVSNGGNQYVQKGGVAISTTVLSNGFETALLSGKTSATTVSNGGTLIVSSGGTASTTTVSSGGLLRVLSTGKATATTVSNGGMMIVSKGGTISGLTVDSGGVLEVMSGALLSGTDTIVSGGILEVGSGYTVGNGTAIAGISGGVANGVTVMDLKGGKTSALTLSSGGHLVVSSGATASGTVISSGGELIINNGATVSGTVFKAGGKVDFAGVVFGSGATVTLNSATDVLTITDGTTTKTLQLAGSYTGEFFHLASDGNGGTIVTEDGTPCYCRGTLILTDRGQVAVEGLRIGDRLITAAGKARPIRWIGVRSYSGRFAAGNKDVLPVLIKQDALADNVPRRDLWVSPLHAMYLDGLLIPASALTNGVSIVQAVKVDSVEYFHLELETHDIIIAEGALSESFLDDNSRGMFRNAATYREIYPDATPRPLLYCAPRVDGGEELEGVRARIKARAAGEDVRAGNPRNPASGWPAISNHAASRY